MKRIYIKPIVYIERFELNQHIAVACDTIVRGFQDVTSCYAVNVDPDFGTEKIFNNGKCEAPGGEVCYWNATGGVPVFGSN